VSRVRRFHRREVTKIHSIRSKRCSFNLYPEEVASTLDRGSLGIYEGCDVVLIPETNAGYKDFWMFFELSRPRSDLLIPGRAIILISLR
jgi:hypothetical protein